jgi:hypothetical protein
MPIYGLIRDFYIRDDYIWDCFVREKFMVPYLRGTKYLFIIYQTSQIQIHINQIFFKLSQYNKYLQKGEKL